jgi:hypothetical protein
VGDGVIEPDDVLTGRFDLCAFGMVRGQMMRFEVTVDKHPGVVRTRFVGVSRRQRRSKHPERRDHGHGNRTEQSTSHGAIIIVARDGLVNMPGPSGRRAPDRRDRPRGLDHSHPVACVAGALDGIAPVFTHFAICMAASRRLFRHLAE